MNVGATRSCVNDFGGKVVVGVDVGVVNWLLLVDPVGRSSWLVEGIIVEARKRSRAWGSKKTEVMEIGLLEGL